MSFVGAPVSQGLISLICISSILAATTSTQHYFDLPLSPHLTRDFQYWRLILHQLAFTNSSELFLSVLLLYFTSVPVERTFGSKKYGSFLVACAFIASILSIASLIIFSKALGFNRIPAGPFIVTFAIISQSIRLVPTVFYWRLFGVEVTSRIALYVLASQLVISQPPQSVYLSLLGYLTSALYLSNFFSLRTFRIPPKLLSLIIKISPIPPTNETIPQRSNVTTLHEAIRLHQTRSENLANNAGGGFVGFMRGGTFLTNGQMSEQGRANGGRRRNAARGATTATTGNAVTPVVPPPPLTTTTPAQTAGFVRQWTRGLGGGENMPTQEQIAELTAIFPEHPREAIVGALQQNALNVEQAAAALLSS